MIGTFTNPADAAVIARIVTFAPARGRCAPRAGVAGLPSMSAARRAGVPSCTGASANSIALPPIGMLVRPGAERV